jgi:CBS domain containing-hemolysin-like protein
MEDVLETLLGMEIIDESDNTVDMQVLARKKWETRARRIALVTEGQEAAEDD